MIESKSGGFKFPDESVQTTSAPNLSVEVAELQALVATLSKIPFNLVADKIQGDLTIPWVTIEFDLSLLPIACDGTNMFIKYISGKAINSVVGIGDLYAAELTLAPGITHVLKPPVSLDPSGIYRFSQEIEVIVPADISSMEVFIRFDVADESASTVGIFGFQATAPTTDRIN